MKKYFTYAVILIIAVAGILKSYSYVKKRLKKHIIHEITINNKVNEGINNNAQITEKEILRKFVFSKLRKALRES